MTNHTYNNGKSVHSIEHKIIENIKYYYEIKIHKQNS